MMRSLYSGISGLKNHQTRMDVVGNNIANVNTVGFKAGRATFQDSLSQQIAGATRPGGLGEGVGGTNPLQIGLGAGVASVDTLHSQGNLQTTGLTTDLAIEGSAFFVVGDGVNQFYTRNGSFSLDANGQLVMPSSGLVLQGMNADDDGMFPATAVVDNITIPFNTQAPARATTVVQFGRNLDADSMAQGTITYSKRFLTNAALTEDYSGLYNSTGKSLGMQVGDTLRFSGTDASNNVQEGTMEVIASTTLDDIRAAMQTFIQTNLGSAGATVTHDATTGALTVNAGGAAVNDLQVTSDRPISSPLITSAFRVDARIPPGDSADTLGLRQPATAATLLANIYDQDGNAPGLQAGDVLSFSGAVNGVVDPSSPLVYDPATTDIGAMLTTLRNQLRLPQTDGTINNNDTVSMNEAGSDDNIPDGTIVVRGLPERAFSLSDVSIRASNANNAVPAPAIFNSNMSFTNFQEARDTGVVPTSITVYDDAGYAHNISVTFMHSEEPDTWLWEAQTAGTETLLAGNRGRITFGPDGTVSNFAFQDSASVLQIDPGNGSGIMNIAFDPGGPGSFQGLTQFRSPSTAAALGQDGHTMGQLRSISVGGDGLVTGMFDNGVSRALAQLMVADFTNPAGLSKQSESVYAATANSGEAVFGRPGSQSTSVVKPGTLEMSNVDIAAEFTEMITTQRGYQANARVISTSDKFLEELVGLVR